MTEPKSTPPSPPAEAKAQGTKPGNGEAQQNMQSASKPQQTKGIDIDIFILDSVFPDPEAIFTFLPKTTEDIKDECVVVLDANTLLIPYLVNEGPLNEIEKTYRQLVETGRLVIPAQAAREFAKHRAMKISQIYQQLYRTQTSVKNVELDRYHLLSDNEAYQDATRLKTEINKQVKQFRDELGLLLEHIRGWTWNDAVSTIYGSLFRGTIREPNISRNDLRKDLVRRHDHKLPPGYKDAGKATEGVGDLLIWHTILDIGRGGKSVIFVSSDEKSDWRVRAEGQAFYPRYELVEEFRRASDGETFHIVDLAGLLKLFGANDAVVSEVKKSEARSVTLQLPAGDIPWIPPLDVASIAVAVWIESTQPDVRFIGEVAEDNSILVLRRAHETFVTFIRLYSTVTYAVAHLEVVKELIGRAHGDLEAGVSQYFVVAAVCPSKAAADDLLAPFYDITTYVPEGCQIALGYLDSSQAFVVRAMHQRQGGRQTFQQ